MLILSDKLLLDIQLMHTFMPNMIHKPWMVSRLLRYVVNNGQNFVNVVKRTAPKDVYLLEFCSEADTLI